MNMNWDAAFAACKSYDAAEGSAALQAVIDAAGGLDWVTPGMRVALKLNLVSAMKPEQAATVHPAVVCALIKLLTARGAHVVLGDSPGGLYTAAHLQRVYDVTGLRAAEALGAELNADFSVCTVWYPRTTTSRNITTNIRRPPILQTCSSTSANTVSRAFASATPSSAWRATARRRAPRGPSAV